MHKSRNPIQRVEKKMRMELRAQSLQLSLRQFGGELCCMQFSLAIAYVIVVTAGRAHQHPIGHEIRMKGVNQRDRAGKSQYVVAAEVVQSPVCEGDSHGNNGMNWQAAPATAALQR